MESWYVEEVLGTEPLTRVQNLGAPDPQTTQPSKTPVRASQGRTGYTVSDLITGETRTGGWEQRRGAFTTG